MKLKFLWAFIFICLLFTGPSVYAAGESPASEKIFNIAVTDTTPLTLDRLVYTAFDDIGYQAEFTPNSELTGYVWTQTGEKDGVISSHPSLETEYPSLFKIPVPLDETSLYAYTPAGSALTIESWDALSGLTVGLLSQHLYVPSRVPADTSVLYKDTGKQLIEGLLAGEYDVAVMARHTYEMVYRESELQASEPLETLTEHLYLHRDYLPLKNKINNALARLKESGHAQQILMNQPVSDTTKKQTVLHILSSSTAITREERFSAELYAMFEEELSFEWYTLALDVKRFPDNVNRLIYFSYLLRQDFLTRNVAAIVVSGDEALQFIEDYYPLFFPQVPILFYGVDAHFDEAFTYYKPYMTGIVARISAEETVSAALALCPKTKNLLVINDFTREGINFRDTISEQLASLSGRIQVTYNDNVTLKDLLAQIRDLPPDSMVLIGSWFTDADGQYYSQHEFARYLVRDCNVPYFSIYSVSQMYGGIGGKAPDYTLYADTAADMLKQLLNGTAAVDIPVLYDSTLNTWVFDKKSIDRFNLSLSALPENALIINTTPSLWETNPLLMYGGLAAFLLIISFTAGLFVIFMRLRMKNKVLLDMRNNLVITRELLAKEQKLAEVKDRLERLINTAPVAYALTVNDVIVEANEYMNRHVGMKVGDSILPYYAFIEQHDTIKAEMEAYGAGSNAIVSFNMPGGGRHRFLANFANTEYEGQKADMLWVMDIEDNERQKDRLSITQRSLQTILDTMPVPVRVNENVTQRIIYANRACLDLFEVPTVADAYGLDLFAFLPPVQPDGIDTLEYLQSYDKTTSPSTLDIACVTASGRVFDTQTVSIQIDYQGLPATLGIIKDLTTEKAYEKMLRATADKEKEANMLKGRFLVNMSHEIRTPMNAIIGLTEIEIRKNPPREAMDVYKKINDSAKSLLYIINDILDLSKIEANKMEIYANEFELEDTLNSALLVATPRLDGKPVECLLKIAMDVPRYLIGDKTRLWQITKNFLDNAAKYTNRGKITLSVSVDTQQTNNETVYISFVVTDTGIGIDDEHLQRIFIPYEQLYSDAQTRYSGTGLGMVISKELCDMMGGKLTVTSKPGVGTSIYYTLPFKRADNLETQRHALLQSVLAGKNILVVDDDVFSLEIMLTLLGSAKANYVSARNGAEALEKIFAYRDRGKMFDCILLDYMMDGLNGLETAMQINLSLSSVPKMLMVTAYQKELVKRDVMDAGFDDIIEKPFVPSQFISQVSAVLGFRQTPSVQSDEKLTRFTGVRVLLCEDNKLNQEVAVGMLAQFGIKPEIAEDGSQALAVLDQRPVDLVLMDLHMPVMDGYEATKVLRSDPLYQEVPIVSLTADAMTEIAEKCRAAGMNDYLTKPIAFSDLHHALRQWLPVHKRILDDESTAPHRGTDQYPHIEGVSYAEGVARFGGIREVYEKTLLSFAKSLPKTWPAFDDIITNPAPMIRDIHQLKGISGNLGVMDVYRLTVSFEKTLKLGKPDARIYTSLTDACFNAESAIQSAITEASAAEGHPSLREEGSREELTDILNHMRVALSNYEPIACGELAESIKAKHWPFADESALKRICELASEYDFDEALALLEDLNE